MQSLSVSYSAFGKHTCTCSQDMIKKMKTFQQLLQLLLFFFQILLLLPSYPRFLPFPLRHPTPPSEQYRTCAGCTERAALEGLQPIKGSRATLWRTGAHKTKRYVCNLAQCLLAGPCSSIVAAAGGKGAGSKRSSALHQGHFIITLHRPTTASLAPIASSTRHYKCQQCPPYSMVYAHILRISPLGLDTCFCPSLSTPLLPQGVEGCTLLHNGHRSWKLIHSAVRLWWCLWWQPLQVLWFKQPIKTAGSVLPEEF